MLHKNANKNLDMKKILLGLALLWVTLLGNAAQAATINGLLVDAGDTTALISATVKLLRTNKDSTYVGGTVTDVNGLFNIKDVKPGHYVIKCSYLGYQNVTKRVEVGPDNRDVNLGVIRLPMTGAMLNEVVVTGVKTPIVVKEDTVEFNADTYKTQANAVVEDLLKRLPGVEVGSDGKITANGKSVSKILIDGKEFFSDDPTVASKNILADMVNKLQVIDRKSDLARLTGVDDGEDETVINLTVKKGMNNGWFGTVNAGYGTHSRCMGNFMANYFTGGNQFTFMGGGNNTNNMGFTDGGASRFQQFGGSNGITSSQNLGFNFNVGTNDGVDEDHETFRAGGDLMYSHSDRDTRSTTARQYLFADSTSYYDAMSRARDKGHNLRGDFRLKWQPDTLNTIEFRPNFTFNFSNSSKTDSSLTTAGDMARTLVNKSLSSYHNDGKSYEFSGQLVFNHKFKYHPGRSYSAQLRYNFSKVDENGDTFTNNTYFLKSDPDETIDQIYDNLRRTNGVNGRVTWTEPLGDIKNARFLTFAYRGNYRYSQAHKMVYDITRDSLNVVQPAPGTASTATMLQLLGDPNFRSYIADEYGDYALTDGMMLANIVNFDLGTEEDRVFNENLSNQFRNTFFNQSFELGFRQVRKAYNLNLGFAVSSAMSKSENLINNARNIPSRWVWTVAPFARLRYKFSKTQNLAFNYRMRSSQPSLAQLQPVADESNPLNIVIGNPELKPTFTHYINLRYSDFAQRSQRSIMSMLRVNFSQNSIISKTTYDAQTGGRVTTYDNVNGVWDAMAFNMFSLPFTRSKVMYFTNHFMTRLSQAKGFNNDQYNRSVTWGFNISPGLAFRNDAFDLEIRPRYSFQTTHNSLPTVGNRNIHTYGGMFDGTYTSPFGLVLSTDLTYSSTSGYSSGYNTTQWRWNASLGYQFLADRTASIQLSVYDILQQTQNINRNVTASYIDDLSFNNLGRYAMLTFTYRFSTFKKGQQPTDRNRRDNFHRGPGGRPPMGGSRPF